MNEKLIGVRAAARILGVHENTVRNFVRRGWLTPYRIRGGEGYMRFDPGDVHALAEAEQAWKNAKALIR